VIQGVFSLGVEKKLPAVVNIKDYGTTLNPGEIKSLPNEFDSDIGPVVAPSGITAVREVELTPTIEVRDRRPILTEVTPSSPRPEIVIMVPTPPEDGDIDVIDGAAVAVVLQAGGAETAISVGRDEAGGTATGA